MKPRLFSLLGFPLLLGLSCLVSGCQEQEDIRHYKASRIEYPEMRMLAAIIPRPDKVWFVKVLGPNHILGQHTQEVEKFVGSLRFTKSKDDPITWSIPDGWRHKPAGGMRHATFYFGPKNEPPLELTLTFLGPENTVLDNVNRWRGQLRLEPVTQEELPRVTREIRVDGVTVTLVDWVGSMPLVRPPSRTVGGGR